MYDMRVICLSCFSPIVTENHRIAVADTFQANIAFCLCEPVMKPSIVKNQKIKCWRKIENISWMDPRNRSRNLSPCIRFSRWRLTEIYQQKEHKRASCSAVGIFITAAQRPVTLRNVRHILLHCQHPLKFAAAKIIVYINFENGALADTRRNIHQNPKKVFLFAKPVFFGVGILVITYSDGN